MERSEIAGKVTENIEDKLCLLKGYAPEEATIIEDLGADSLDLIEMVMDFEKEFKISISDHETEKVNTVKDIIDLIVEKTK